MSLCRIFQLNKSNPLALVQIIYNLMRATLGHINYQKVQNVIQEGCYMIFKPQHLRLLKNIRPPIEFFYNCLFNSNSLLGFKNWFQDWVLNFWPLYKIISHNDTSSLRITALGEEIKIKLRVCLILCQILIKVLLVHILRIMLSLPINRQKLTKPCLPKALQTSSERTLT